MEDRLVTKSPWLSVFPPIKMRKKYSRQHWEYWDEACGFSKRAPSDLWNPIAFVSISVTFAAFQIAWVMFIKAKINTASRYSRQPLPLQAAFINYLSLFADRWICVRNRSWINEKQVQLNPFAHMKPIPTWYHQKPSWWLVMLQLCREGCFFGQVYHITTFLGMARILNAWRKPVLPGFDTSCVIASKQYIYMYNSLLLPLHHYWCLKKADRCFSMLDFIQMGTLGSEHHNWIFRERSFRVSCTILGINRQCNASQIGIICKPGTHVVVYRALGPPFLSLLFLPYLAKS